MGTNQSLSILSVINPSAHQRRVIESISIITAVSNYSEIEKNNTEISDDNSTGQHLTRY